MNQFNVYNHLGVMVDTVSHVSDDADEVRHGLVSHDGFPDSIVIVRAPDRKVSFIGRTPGAIGIRHKIETGVPLELTETEDIRDYLYSVGYEMVGSITNKG